ncbi:MAG TPA: class I SAM-dependent methyltransferase [Chloroflexota bacterium]|nr:class I SAM-dependent methyltransferase [Chloroflexota bacterium]
MSSLTGAIQARFRANARLTPFLRELLRLAGGLRRTYVAVDDEEPSAVAARHSDAWRHGTVPQAQRQLVDQQITQFRKGVRIDVFDAFVELLRRNVDRLDQSSIVEIGCSSGYYAEVLEICGIQAQYYGADYSLHFVDLARKYYPAIPFAVQDATHLGYRDRSFDIVVSGCCLPYVSDFRLAVAEAVRVARRFVLFHRTPVLQKTETLAFVKHAYGVKMPEIHFNEPALFRTLGAHGLRVVDMAVLTVDWVPQLQDSVAWKSYLCAKEQPLEVGI